MTIQELATAVSYELPVKVAMLNNGYLGMVRQWQELFWNKRYSHTCIERAAGLRKLAEAYGAVGMTVTTQDEVERRPARGHRPRPAGGDRLPRAPEENVFPMVPAGAGRSPR